jgi:hypothetical protein
MTSTTRKALAIFKIVNAGRKAGVSDSDIIASLVVELAERSTFADVRKYAQDLNVPSPFKSQLTPVKTTV